MITVNDNKFIVVRLPALMEDEGNWHVLSICDSLQEVAEFCYGYTEGGEGYFHLSELIYIGSHFGHGGAVTSELRPYLPQNVRVWFESVMKAR